MAAEKAVVAKLLATAVVTDLVGARIEPLLVPERTTYPLVVYRQVARAPVSAFGGDVGLTETELELSAVAKTHADARALADALQGTLQRWRGSAGGITVQGTFFENEVEDYDPDARVFVIRQDYRVWTEEA